MGESIHIEYIFEYSRESNKVCVEVSNEGEKKHSGIFHIGVDNISATPEVSEVAPNESNHYKVNISNHLDSLEKNHTVEMGAWGTSYTYNFTREIDSTARNSLSPYIEDVEVARYEDNGSSALRVAVRNPTERGYGMYVQAKTFGTKRVYTTGAPQPNETKVFTLPLEEGSDAVVAGKVRIFDDWGDPDTKYGQVEFMSEPGADTESWQKEFEHMPGTDSEAPYQNESARHARSGVVDEDYYSERTQKIGAAGVVVLLVAAVAWRRRRKFR